MDIDDSSDLIYYTYYMVDWQKVAQTPSDADCVTCGQRMMEVEAVRDKKTGATFAGRVCHRCKTVLWFRQQK